MVIKHSIMNKNYTAKVNSAPLQSSTPFKLIVMEIKLSYGNTAVALRRKPNTTKKEVRKSIK